MVRGKGKMHIVTIKLDEELLTKLDLYAVNNKMYRSEVIREALQQYLKDKKINRVTSTF